MSETTHRETIERLTRERDALHARVRVLEDALRPFAECAFGDDPSFPQERGSRLTSSCYRAAAAVLAQAVGGEEPMPFMRGTSNTTVSVEADLWCKTNARLAALEAALRPFADASERVPDWVRGTYHPSESRMGWDFGRTWAEKDDVAGIRLGINAAHLDAARLALVKPVGGGS